MTKQNYAQKHHERCATYVQAKAVFDSWKHVERKRIKRRPDGNFDVIEFEKLPPSKSSTASEVEA